MGNMKDNFAFPEEKAIMIDSYRLVSKLAKGRMGIVYEVIFRIALALDCLHKRESYIEILNLRIFI